MKRKRKARGELQAVKRVKIPDVQSRGEPTWALLQYYYPNVSTLRQYLAAKLSKTSRNRCRALLRYRRSQQRDESSTEDKALSHLLDSTIVGSFNTAGVDLDAVERDITVFTQQLSDSTTSISPTQGALKQAEIVDFVIWLLFRRHHGPYRPSHLLCQGFQRHASGPDAANIEVVTGMPGVFCSGPNNHVQALRRAPWCELPSLLGKGAERVLSELLLQCGIFSPAEGTSNLSQLSGVPLSELQPAKAREAEYDAEQATGQPSQKVSPKGLSDIRFVRHRMLYARPTSNSKGAVTYALGPTHVLNRYRNLESAEQDTHILKHIFPRQFGLHNVFTSEVDRTDTAQPFKDYTFREQEISKADCLWIAKQHAAARSEDSPARLLPKRLRGHAVMLAHRLRKRHAECSHAALLQHYCPSPTAMSAEQPSTFAQASSMVQVSAFCRAAVRNIVPPGFWGTGEQGKQNQGHVMRAIDTFVRLRRYESLSLHDVLQGIQIRSVPWLVPYSLHVESKISQTDFAKRLELMAEFVYYIFDSLLIPLLRGHFHVTESGAHRNQLFYFRHDVWKALSEPALASLRDSMLEHCNTADIKRELATRALGVSRVRLLPKDQGMRPIINLRRRVQKLQQGRWVLGRSINSILTPTFAVLNHEKESNGEMLQSALFSVEDMYPRLQNFRRSLQGQGVGDVPLYFAKVDVKACFDTIPQKRLMQLVRQVITNEEYQVAKYSRAKMVGGHNQETPGFGAKPSWKFLTRAAPSDKAFDMEREMQVDGAGGRTRTVYVDGGAQRSERRQALLKLLEEHVESNLIRVGNRYYRQKAGIPQGSIVSSLLCSYFYSEMEREKLDFVDDGQTLLLRLIDDFLIISAKRHIAEQFMQVMHAGIEEFGVDVKIEKSRANFDVMIDGQPITRLPARTAFPYCGNAIDTVTLDLSKDRERRKKSNLPDSMSVEYSKLPGQTFYRKTLNALKLQMQAMLLSTSYNKLSTVLANLCHAFDEVASKSYHYVRSLPAIKQPGTNLLIKTVDDTIKLACVLMKQRKRTSKDIVPYECALSVAQARWLACTAFQTVFTRRQTNYGGLLAWLDEQLALPAVRAQAPMLRSIVEQQQ